LAAVVFLAHFSDARLDVLDLSFDLLGVVVVPFVVVSWAIGFVVYFNHTHPETSA
jgi:hypothetical protein